MERSKQMLAHKFLNTLKAWVAGAAVLVTALGDVLEDSAISWPEVGVVGAAATAAWSLVYFVPPKVAKDDE